MTTSYILWNIFLGALGMAYIVYAKTQRKIVPFLGGVILLVIPYVSSVLWLYLLVILIVIIVSYYYNI